MIAADALETLLLPVVLLPCVSIDDCWDTVLDCIVPAALDALVLNDSAVPLLTLTVLDAADATKLSVELSSAAYWLLVATPAWLFSLCFER